MKQLVDLIYSPIEEWDEKARPAFSDALQARYPRVSDLREKHNGEKRFQLRVNTQRDMIPFAGLLPPDQELSGGYGGMSFVIFPADEPGNPALVAMGIGTRGLAPDEMILGRPGHGRKCQAIARWANDLLAGSAWAKKDPVRIDLPIPSSLAPQLSAWTNTYASRYNPLLYLLFMPPRKTDNPEVVSNVVTALLDLFFEERGIEPKANSVQSASLLRSQWMALLLPQVGEDKITGLLDARRFVILEGPPGTGKTRAAERILNEKYNGNGRVVQFHPGTTYESFIGGLAPREGGAVGFTFSPKPGHLMEAAIEAAKSATPYLFVIDEINRAGLSQVLGEAIVLFEAGHAPREIRLAHEFSICGSAPTDRFRLPENLHVLGTMNTADRSIAILDVAVRRRFAFITIWPQLSVVERLAPDFAEQFADLINLFIEHSSDEGLALLPGHSYFLPLPRDPANILQTTLKPLLEEYIAQGLVTGFADELRAYIDRLPQ